MLSICIDLLLPSGLSRNRTLAIRRRERASCSPSRGLAEQREIDMEELHRGLFRMEALHTLRHILRNLLSFQLTGFLHTYNHRWPRLRQASVPADDGTTLRRCIRGHDCRLMVR